MKLANEKRQRIRAVGSGLSPNGIGLSDEGMINLALMDKILSVDQETKTVRVQAGARVAEVVEALRPHGLTLQNYASIREQQIGGFIQVIIPRLYHSWTVAGSWGLIGDDGSFSTAMLPCILWVYL